MKCNITVKKKDLYWDGGLCMYRPRRHKEEKSYRFGGVDVWVKESTFHLLLRMILKN